MKNTPGARSIAADQHVTTVLRSHCNISNKSTTLKYTLHIIDEADDVTPAMLMTTCNQAPNSSIGFAPVSGDILVNTVPAFSDNLMMTHEVQDGNTELKLY